MHHCFFFLYIYIKDSFFNPPLLEGKALLWTLCHLFLHKCPSFRCDVQIWIDECTVNGQSALTFFLFFSFRYMDLDVTGLPTTAKENPSSPWIHWRPSSLRNKWSSPEPLLPDMGWLIPSARLLSQLLPARTMNAKGSGRSQPLEWEGVDQCHTQVLRDWIENCVKGSQGTGGFPVNRISRNNYGSLFKILSNRQVECKVEIPRRRFCSVCRISRDKGAVCIVERPGTGYQNF